MKPLRTCILIGIFAVTTLGGMFVPASAAGYAVDSETLIPAPPGGAQCRNDGNWVICHTAVVFEPVNEPILDLPCGTVYETSLDARRGIRWYDASSRIIARRFVAFDLEGTWSLSPNGNTPTVMVTVHAISRDVEFPDPLDPDTWPTAYEGVGLTVRAPGFGVIAQFGHADGYHPDEDAHGVGDAVEEPAVAAELCAALGG